VASVADGRSAVAPALVVAAADNGARRFLEFFALTIENPDTRAAYFHACRRFFAWCEASTDIDEIADIEPMHVAAYIRGLGKDFEKPTVKQPCQTRMSFALNPARSG
jgi:integrase/recombinase XerC